MRRHQLTLDAEDAWLTVRGDLDELARAYHVAWNWSNPRYTPAGRDTDLYHRLTGTYQLDSSRGDNPREAAEQAVRAVPSDKRPRMYESLINRLEAPDVIAIDRNENSVTIGSSRGQRATFEAESARRSRLPRRRRIPGRPDAPAGGPPDVPRPWERSTVLPR